MHKKLAYLRRFGLEYCDLPTIVENIDFLLRLSYVNIERNNTQRIPIIFYIVAILTGASHIYVYVISMVWFVFVRCQETGDIAAASVIYSLGICSLTGIAKILYIYVYKNTIQNIVEEYLTDYALVKPDTRYCNNLLKALRDVKKRALGFWLFLSANAVIYIAIAICLPGRHFVEDLCVIYGLEPMFESPNYEIAFMMMTAGIYFAVPLEIYTSAFLIVFVGYAEAQIVALSEEVNNIWDDTNQSYLVCEELIGTKKNKSKDTIFNELIQKQLKDIIRKHVTAIKCVYQIENIFKGAMAIEIGILTSGLIAELLGGLENTYAQFPYTLIQIAMDCFIGQRLIDASLVLENAIYGCKWEYFNASNQKTVYLMLMNSQKNLTLSVGGVTILSFAYFTSILKAIYSAYTTLRSKV